MDGPPAPAAAEAYDQIFRLERNLLAASRTKGPFDPAVRRLRNSIRDGYEALILRDLALCESFEVEQALWRLHYREIEGFRVRIRRLLTSKTPAEDNAALGSRGKKRKKENKHEPLLRALTSFRSFLGEASGFFHGLLIKLRLQHGLASSVGNTDRLSAEGDLTEELRRCMVTCHRILIYLGDLARYKELYAVMDVSVRDWSVAANYYKQAAFLWPSSGNPYNQLAVLCTYCGNTLTALYLYCRSLAVSVPFVTAWDNVVLLFEKNKQHFARACFPRSDCDKKSWCETTLPTNLHGFVIEQDLWSTYSVGRSQGLFVMHFVELVRILLTQSSADELDKAIDVTEREIEQFLHAELDAVNQSKSSSKLEGSTPLALQAMMVLIFCMHHIIGQPNLMDRDRVLSSSLKFTFKFGSLLAKVAEEEETWSAFPVAVIFMEWLASQPEALQITEREVVAASSFAEFCERVITLDVSLISKVAADDHMEDTKVSRKDHLSRSIDKAQWEDHELLGFIPLAPGHLNLDFSMQLPGYGVCDLATYSCWKLRYTEALQKSCNTSGCLLKLPDASHFDLAAEESPVGVNPTPSLKEWIEKTFFSTELLSDLAPAKHGQVQCNRICLHDEAVSTTQALKTAGLKCLSDDPGDVQINSQHNAQSLHCEASVEMIMQSGEHFLEKCKDMDKPVSIEAPQVLATGIVVKCNAVSPTKADTVMVEREPDLNSRGELNDYDCGERSPTLDCGGRSPTFDAAGHDPPNSSMIMIKTSDSLHDRGGKRILTFGTRKKGLNRDLLGNYMVVNSHPHKQQPIPLVACFDSITHVKPKGFMEAITGPRSSHSLNSAFKINARSFRYDGLLTWNNKAYESQNPFALRLSKMS